MPTALIKIGYNSFLLKQYVVNNIVLVFLMTVISSAVFSQEKNFQLIGSIRGIDTGTIKLSCWLIGTSNKSFISQIKQGKFVLKGKINHPLKVNAIVNESYYSDAFFIEPGDQEIYFDGTSKKNFSESIQVTGSIVNDEYNNYYRKPLQPFYDELDRCYDVLDSLNKIFVDEKPVSVFTGACKNFNRAIKNLNSAKKAFIVKNPSSYVSLWALYTAIWGLDDLEFVEESFKYLTSDLQNSFVGKQLAHRLDVQKAFLNEKIFPTMMCVDSNEKKVSSQEIINRKYTLIDFWFSHCGPCIVQFPMMRNLYAKYKNVGFEMVGISIDKTEDKRAWLDAISKHKLEWKQYWDIDGKEAKRFFIDTYPTNLLLDSKGRIIKKNILIEELEIFLATNLQ
jgi:thiol-disulfide isomerase/thioredoxin